MKDLDKIVSWYFKDLVNFEMNMNKIYKKIKLCLKN